MLVIPLHNGNLTETAKSDHFHFSAIISENDEQRLVTEYAEYRDRHEVKVKLVLSYEFSIS